MYDITKIYNRKPETPCKDCSERKLGCHGKCERYKLWGEECASLRNKIYNEKGKEDIQSEFAIKTFYIRNKGWKK